MLEFLFKNKELRVINLAKVDWFNAKDICRILNMTNPYRILKQFVLPKYYSSIQENKSGRPSLYVAEPGLYALMFQAKTENAKEFQMWVFEEVLPSIRKQGFYLDKQALVEDSEKLALLESETAILKQENFALKQYIDDVPAKINQAKQVGIEQGKIMVIKSETSVQSIK